MFARSRWLKKVQHDFFWSYDTGLASHDIPLHLLLQDDQNEMKHDFFSHLTLLALASSDVNGSANNTIVFIVSRQLK